MAMRAQWGFSTFSAKVCTLYSAVANKAIYRAMQLFGFEAKICSCIFLLPDGAILSSLSSKRYWQTSAVRSESFFDNEPKQILSAIPDLSAKNKQTVAPSVRGTATTTKQPMLLLLRFQIIQSTLPYMQPSFSFCSLRPLPWAGMGWRVAVFKRLAGLLACPRLGLREKVKPIRPYSLLKVNDATELGSHNCVDKVFSKSALYESFFELLLKLSRVAHFTKTIQRTRMFI